MGVDVAKAPLDVAVRGAAIALQAVDNDRAGHTVLVETLRPVAPLLLESRLRP